MSGRRRRGHRAGQDRRHGVPDADAAAVAHHARQPAAAARNRAAASPRNPPQQGAICRARREAAGLGRPRRLRQQVSLATVRRHAAARLALPRADPRAAAADAGRAVRRARCLHARGTVVRDPRPAGGARHHRGPRHPRPARGGVPRRPHLRDVAAARPHRGRARGRLPAPARSRNHLHARNSPTSCTNCAVTSIRRANEQVQDLHPAGALAFHHRAVPGLGNRLPRVQDSGILPAAADRGVQGDGRVLAGDPAQFLDHARSHAGRLPDGGRLRTRCSGS